MKIVTAEEMRAIDRITSERFGVPSPTLMENAGTAVAEFILARYSGIKSVGIVCGKGNNGGDGFVAARKLQEAGKKVGLILLANPGDLRGDAATMFQRLQSDSVIVRSSDELRTENARTVLQSDLILDAILGTGFHPPATGLYAAAIARINELNVPVVAVDIPSGTDADVMGSQTGTVVQADAIVTFTAPRPAHVFGGLAKGPTLVNPIGSPDEAITSSLNLNVITPRDIASLLAPRKRDANKGNFGHVLVVGGSLGKAGAPAMAGMSALRVGAGLSTVATAKSVLPTVAGFHPELMTEPLAETDEGTVSSRAFDYGRMDSLIAGKTVVAVGPGISHGTETTEFVRNLVSRCKLPMVVDADGLNAFQGAADELHGRERPLVITPHPGEMARLTGLTVPEVQRDRIGVARTFARDHHCITVLKGHRTLVAAPDAVIWVNTTGNPGMATGGTGDILTGMVAGLMAQHSDRLLEAVLLAVYVHGLTGDISAEKWGEQSLVATDLLPALPEAFARIRVKANQNEFEFS